MHGLRPARVHAMTSQSLSESCLFGYIIQCCAWQLGVAALYIGQTEQIFISIAMSMFESYDTMGENTLQKS